MTPFIVYAATGALLWVLGLIGLLLVTDMLRRVIAVNIMSTGVFLVLVAQMSLSEPKDPVLQALVVTGLVVAVSATAFALRLANAAAGAGASSSSHSRSADPDNSTEEDVPG